MASTRFSGPILVGSDKNNSIATVGATRRSNVTIAFNTTSGTALGITIPANSQILGMQLVIDELFANSSTTTISVGTSTAANELTADTNIVATAAIAVMSPKITGGANTWATVGTTDVDLYAIVTTNSATAGSGKVIVEYVQNSNPYVADNGAK
jgi:hypothetical protein